jgi:hypothetical protein
LTVPKCAALLKVFNSMSEFRFQPVSKQVNDTCDNAPVNIVPIQTEFEF